MFRVPASGLRAAWVLFAAFAISACTQGSADPCAGHTCEKAGYVCVAGSGGEPLCIPPSDPCGAANPCKADERCVVTIDGVASCLAPDRCALVSCGLTKRCDPSTGQCSIDRKPCDGVTCAPGLTCNEDSGRCEDLNSKCGLVCCDSTQVCDPASGTCVVDLCDDPQNSCLCGPSEVCNGVTGKCDPVVSSCGTCASNEYCDLLIGSCVVIGRGTPNAGEIGGACGTATDCNRGGPDAFCLTDGGLFGAMPGGSCSASCNQSTCPRGSGCVNVGLQICLDICLTNGDCREGYVCSQVSSADPRRYCFPAGSGGSTCQGAGCAAIGGACAENDDCVSGSECIRYLPGGYCQKRNCKASDCDEESERCWCLTADACSGAKIALSKCDTTAQDCRSGYACIPLTSDNKQGYCYPRTCEEDVDCRPAGTSCSHTCDKVRGVCDTFCTNDDQCYGGRSCDTATGHCYQPCRSSNANCGPDGLCDTQAGRCVRKCRSDAMCGEGDYCNRLTGRCQALCTTDVSCGTGRFCDNTGRCHDACVVDTDCGTNDYCEAGRCLSRCTSTFNCTLGEFCNPTSGRCVRDLKSVLTGSPCTRSNDCGAYNAECMVGWPDGYCVATDCSVDALCGPGAVCALNGNRMDCMKSCTADGDCRSGYRCVEDGGVKACRAGPI